MRSFFRVVWLVLRKDMTVEVRSFEIISTTLFFAVSVVLFFAFALVINVADSPGFRSEVKDEK